MARALEEVDQQVKSLEQCVIHSTSSNSFLDNFLNVDDEMLAESSDICEDVLSTAPVKNDVRSLVQT